MYLFFHLTQYWEFQGSKAIGKASEMHPENNVKIFCQHNTNTDQATLRVLKASAISLYEETLKENCTQLLALNRSLLKSERNQRIKQIFYRLSWVGGLSVAVVLISYLTVGINLITAIGLLVAYFLGLILHDKFSPSFALPKEAEQLYAVNNQLRKVIASKEKKEQGLLFPLLEATGLLEKARNKGLQLKDEKVDCYQLDGNGLYQYLDAMNLIMEHRNQWDSEH